MEHRIVRRNGRKISYEQLFFVVATKTENYVATNNGTICSYEKQKETYTENNFAAKTQINKYILVWCGHFWNKTNVFAKSSRNHIHIKKREDVIQKTEMLTYKNVNYIVTKHRKCIATKNGKLYSYKN